MQLADQTGIRARHDLRATAKPEGAHRPEKQERIE
jgi:hypothetical protein